VPDGERVSVEVLDVVDGDTVDVRMPDGSEDTVRLVGIDTPEVHAENDPAEFEGIPDTRAGASCLREAGHNASAYVEQRIAAGNVSLVFDPNTDRRGGYGRLLAYVYVGEHNLNYDLVATGNARVYDTDLMLRSEFDRAEQRARNQQHALWTCQTAG
jgi:micrococcal nuclease